MAWRDRNPLAQPWQAEKVSGERDREGGDPTDSRQRGFRRGGEERSRVSQRLTTTMASSLPKIFETWSKNSAFLSRPKGSAVNSEIEMSPATIFSEKRGQRWISHLRE